MKITILQTDIVWGEPSLNLINIDKLLKKIDNTDLIILPEMFSTGFYIEPEGVAETNNGVSLKWMKETAKKRDCAMAGSLTICDDNKYYNRLYFVQPDGKVDYYDKKHLFSYGGESNFYTSGDKRVIVEYKGVRILLQICYDLRFPVFSRNQNDYDMIIYVANWPIPRRGAWDILPKARAIENQCYVAAVNRVGNDPYCKYNGGSVVVDPYGIVVSSCQDSCQSFSNVDIDLEELNEFRKKFPVLEDSDSFELK